MCVCVFPGAKANLRDYSGHLAFHYLKMKEPEGPEEDGELREPLPFSSCTHVCDAVDQL